MSEQEYHDAPQEQAKRAVPDLLRQAWETATGDEDPLVALGATRALRAHLSTWEAQLVKEAVADGATWESIGDSVGVSRQAAWDRFHHEVHELRRQMRAEAEDLRRRYRDETRQLRHRYRDQILERRPGRGRRHDRDEESASE